MHNKFKYRIKHRNTFGAQPGFKSRLSENDLALILHL
jgi:hypothetical protein